MNTHPIYKHELVTFTIPANQTPTRIYFPDVPNLRDVHLLGLTSYNNKQLKPFLTGEAVIDELVQNNSYLTLQLYNGKEFCHQMPLTEMKPYQYADLGVETFFNNYKRDFTGQKVNFPKSYVELAPYAPAAFDRLFVFSVYYRESKAIEEKDNSFEFKKNMQ